VLPKKQTFRPIKATRRDKRFLSLARK